MFRLNRFQIERTAVVETSPWDSPPVKKGRFLRLVKNNTYLVWNETYTRWMILILCKAFFGPVVRIQSNILVISEIVNCFWFPQDCLTSAPNLSLFNKLVIVLTSVIDKLLEEDSSGFNETASSLQKTFVQRLPLIINLDWEQVRRSKFCVICIMHGIIFKAKKCMQLDHWGFSWILWCLVCCGIQRTWCSKPSVFPNLVDGFVQCRIARCCALSFHCGMKLRLAGARFWRTNKLENRVENKFYFF